MIIERWRIWSHWIHWNLNLKNHVSIMFLTCKCQFFLINEVFVHEKTNHLRNPTSHEEINNLGFYI
jgi:hypothetical protein